MDNIVEVGDKEQFAKFEDSRDLQVCCDDGRARFTAHTSFNDPSNPPNAAPRESIEVRALVFWPLETT